MANASVTVSPQSTGNIAALSAQNSQLLTADENGDLVLPDLSPGRYVLSITIGDVTVSTVLEILPNNAAESTTVAAPIVVSEDPEGDLLAESLEGKGIFASLTGVIYGDSGVLENVQIELSGGVGTNGAVASAVTNADGEFSLIINVSLDKLLAMREATIRIVREGFQTQYIPFNVAEIANVQTVTAIAGLNYSLQPQTELVETFYQEDFEQLTDGAVCGMWSAASFEAITPPEGIPDDVPGEEPVKVIPTSLSILVAANLDAVEEAEALNLWHSHSSGLSIINQAVVENLVSLAPDDQSGGKIPDPQGNYACWYGQSAAGNVGQGNFLGDIDDTNGGVESDGGESDRYNAGAIVSPLIDLTNASAPLALDFNTWWEIESVNPNENGFDLMIISVSTDNGSSWSDIARLNPLSDPIGGERAPLPYSNRGFNKAPLWLSQEPVSLSDFAGQQIKLRFAFTTQDSLYNGFRGWLVDDIAIYQGEGSFPGSQQGVEFGDYIAGGLGNFNVETSTLNYSGEVVSGEAVVLQLLAYNEIGEPSVISEQALNTGDFSVSATFDATNSAYVIFAARVLIDEQVVSESVITTYSSNDSGDTETPQ